MAGAAVNENLLLLSKFGEGGQESTAKTATKPYAKRYALVLVK